MSLKNFLFLLLFFSHYISLAQKKDSLHVSFFFDGYVSWIPSSGKAARPPYVVNYVGLNSAGLNFLSGNLHYRHKNFRTTLGAMAGEYVQKNLISEDPVVRNIYEANIGLSIIAKENVWLDVGVLPSHIGIETVPGFKNITATRNIISDITPYYETGLRLSYAPNNKWYIAMLALNGWQRITAPLHAIGKNWGMQIQYRPTSYMLINSSSFLGEIPEFEKIGVRRIYSNFYSIIDLNPRMQLTLGWDWGMQGEKAQQWNDFLMMYRYIVKDKKIFLASRLELLSDPNRLFIGNSNMMKEAKYQMASLNIDILPLSNLMLRTELNYLIANQPILQNMSFSDQHQLSLFFILSAQLDYKK